MSPAQALHRTAGDDRRRQQLVLSVLLELHPGLCSVDEIVREIAEHPDGPVCRELVTNAIRDLVGGGLAHRLGSYVFATRAAARFDELQS